MKLAVVVLAAGLGTRMRSQTPKMLHALNGRPMITYAALLAERLGAERRVLVVGHGAEAVRACLQDRCEYVEQNELLGTGHAVLQAMPLLKDTVDAVMVYYGDMPLVRAETLQALYDLFQAHEAPLTMVTFVGNEPRGFGRIERTSDGRIAGIVEEVQCTPEQLAIRELNPGFYCFSALWLWEHLPRLPLSPKGEYYLTDLVGMAVDEGCDIPTLPAADPDEMLGINTRVDLAAAERVLRRRINERLMLAGVTIMDPDTTYIQDGVEVGQDTVIYPNTHLWGDTRIGRNCQIGPNAVVRAAQIGDQCRVEASCVEEAIMEQGSEIGPFGHLRKGAHLGPGVHMGNFGEVKNSYLGPGVKMGHFSYLGDATVGMDVNIGAGTITCNYDGKHKHRTVIDDGAFIGSDTMLVAPVRVGRGAITGAGSVVTRDVDPDAVVVGVPARARARSKSVDITGDAKEQ